jgi:mRNA interferase HicA
MRDNIQSSNTGTVRAMKYSEFRRYLISLGAIFTPGKGSHQKVTLNGRNSIFPNHGSKEMPKGLEMSIRKDLGI